MIEIKDTIKVEDLLYPKSKPYDTGHLDVGDGHQLFYQQYGNPNGPVVLLVHGGPGGGVTEGENLTRLHDPHYFRIIAVDQRGCGQSTPHIATDTKRALKNNTIDKLTDDFEIIRKYLNVSAWHIFGSSWGACLGPYYAVRYPKAVLSLTIAGIWLHTPAEIDWYINRMGLFFPEEEAKLLAVLPKAMKRFDRLDTLYKALTGKDQKQALKVAGAQGHFEFMCGFFVPPAQGLAALPKRTMAQQAVFEKKMIAVGGLEIFFMKEEPLPSGWFKTKEAQKALKTVKDISIIQGRYDIVCPPTTAYELHVAHPHSTLTMVHYAGHKVSDPQMMQTVIRENNRLKK